jgi:hypothetical protein
MDGVAAKLLGESTRCPGINNPTRPRGDFYDNAMRLDFNASWRTVMHEGTS